MPVFQSDRISGIASSTGPCPGRGRCRLTHTLSLLNLALSRPLKFNPGLRERMEIVERSQDHQSLPLGHFPEGQQFSSRERDRPSGKRPRRPTALAEIRSLRRSPWVAPLDVVRTVAQIGRVLQDNIKDGTPRRRGVLLDCMVEVPVSEAGTATAADGSNQGPRRGTARRAHYQCRNPSPTRRTRWQSPTLSP